MGVADLIINGSVAVKSGVEIQVFRENGVQFTDGSELDIDGVIFACVFVLLHNEPRKHEE